MPINIGIILAAGKSTRFGQDKPFFKIKGKTLLERSFEAMSGLDELIVVTNSACCDKFETKHTVVVNDIDCRLESIRTALCHIQTADNVIIHDVARPFITKQHIDVMLHEAKTYPCVQYCLKIVNGLIKKTDAGYFQADRDQYIELCTPQLVNYQLCDMLFKNHINQMTYEVIPTLKWFQKDFKLLEGEWADLRKITTPSDALETSCDFR